MKFRAVAFVLSKTVFRKLHAEATHDPIARDLGDHASGCDRLANAVPVDDGRLRKWKWEYG